MAEIWEWLIGIGITLLIGSGLATWVWQVINKLTSRNQQLEIDASTGWQAQINQEIEAIKADQHAIWEEVRAWKKQVEEDHAAEIEEVHMKAKARDRGLEQKVTGLEKRLKEEYYARRDLDPRLRALEALSKQILVAVLHRNATDVQSLQSKIEDDDGDTS